MAGLTKQHFNEIAKIINENLTFDNGDRSESYITLNVINGLSDYFKTQNPLFNENQFKKACLE